jgi:Flp pilus assembly pilin Flp
MLYRKLKRFLGEDRAQDLIEYSLLIAFVGLVSVGLMSQAGGGVQGIWSGASSTIAVANGGSPDTTTPPPGNGGGGGDGHHHGDDGR